MDHFGSFGIEVGKKRFYEEAVYGVALVYAALYNEISAYLDRYGLSPAKMNALMIIKHQGKDTGISQIAIGKRLMVTASNMTRLIDNLEKDGLIERCAHRQDRRVNVIRITQKGAKLMDDIWPGYQQIIKNLAGTVPAADQKHISRLLRRWFEQMKDRG